MPEYKQRVRSLCFIFSLVVYNFLPVFNSPVLSAQEPYQSIRITEVNVVGKGASRVEVVIKADGPIRIEPFQLKEPHRLYLDVLGTNVFGESSEQTQAVSHPVMGTLRKVFMEPPSQGKKWARLDGVMLDLGKEQPFRILEASEKHFVIEIGTLSHEEWKDLTRQRFAKRMAAGTLQQTAFRQVARSPVEQKFYQQVQEELRKRAGLDAEEETPEENLTQEVSVREDAIVLLKREVQVLGEHSHVFLQFSRPARIVAFPLTDPERIVIDFLNQNIYSDYPRLLQTTGPHISSVEALYYENEPRQADGSKRLDSVHIHLSHKLPYKIEEQNGIIQVRVGAAVKPAEPKRPAPVVKKTSVVDETEFTDKPFVKRDAPGREQDAPIVVEEAPMKEPAEKLSGEPMHEESAAPVQTVEKSLIPETKEVLKKAASKKVSEKTPSPDVQEEPLSLGDMEAKKLISSARKALGGGQPKRAAKRFRKALDIKPSPKREFVREAREGLSDALTAWARKALEEYDYPEAQKRAEQALQVDPNHSDARRLRDRLIRRKELYDLVRNEVELRLDALNAGLEEAEEAHQTAERQSHLDEAKEMIRDLSLESVVGITLGEDEEVLDEEDAVRMGLANYGGLRVAEKERMVAQARVAESRRALFPNATIKFTDTEGEVFKVGFTERTYGIEFEQPLYTSGVLTNTLRQARTSLRLTHIRYEKTRQEYALRILEAYYDLLDSQMNHQIQKALWDESQIALRQAKARFERGLSRRLEILNVQTQANQVGFQLASAERELLLARYKFKELLGHEESLFYQVPDISFSDAFRFEPLVINLDTVMELAAENNPDLAIAKHQMEISRYEERIARGKGGMRVDLTGFIGQGGSNFETEDLDLNTEHSVGVRVTRLFGSNTISTSLTDDSAAQRLGETDEKSSTVRSIEFNVLDALKGKGDMLEAQVATGRAEEEHKDIRFNVAVETQEAFYGYQEAVLQVRNAVEKVRYQEEAARIAETEAGLNTALTSDLLSAKIKLADEKSLYVQALSNYNLSIVKLNKAIGLFGHYKVSQ